MSKQEKLCLITPPSPFLLDERVFMSLGILTVAAVLERSGLYDIDMLDLSGIKNYLDAVETYIKQNPDVETFCITSTTPQLPLVNKINNLLKKNNKRVIAGGPHFTLINSAYKKEKNNGKSGRATTAMNKLKKVFDTIVCGDGEYAIFEALKGEKFVDADDKKSDLFMSNQQFTDTPFPARHLVDVDSYNFHIEGKKALTLIGQLGCPFMCGFCSGRNSPTFRKIRTRSVENIMEEMEFMHKTWGVEGFTFYDDELNVNKKLPDLLRLIIDYQNKNKVKFNLRGCIKSELLTEEQAELMSEAGFRKLLVGFESGSPRILDNINKRASLEDNTKCIEIGRKYGIELKALMSIGHPGESQETIKETKLWLKDVKPEEFDVTIITVIPGSPYYDDAELVKGTLNIGADKVLEGENVWAYKTSHTKGYSDVLYSIEVDNLKEFEYYKGIPGEYNAFVFTDFLSRKDLVNYRDEIDTEVTKFLGHTRNMSVEAQLYEHSMGMLPNTILRSSLAKDNNFPKPKKVMLPVFK